MKIRSQPEPKGVYIDVRDRRRKRKSVHLTVEGLTPKQAAEVIQKLLRDHLRQTCRRAS